MEDVYSRIRKRTKPATRQKVTGQLAIAHFLNMKEKTYSKEEVQELLDPLMKQIEFYNQQNIQLKEYILINWIPFGNKSNFLKSIRIGEDNSDTLIFNLLKQWENERL